MNTHGKFLNQVEVVGLVMMEKSKRPEFYKLNGRSVVKIFKVVTGHLLLFVSNILVIWALYFS